jgi:hypothetical protein
VNAAVPSPVAALIARLAVQELPSSGPVEMRARVIAGCPCGVSVSVGVEAAGSLKPSETTKVPVESGEARDSVTVPTGPLVTSVTTAFELICVPTLPTRSVPWKAKAAAPDAML